MTNLLDSPQAKQDRPPATGIKRHLPNLLSITRLLLLPVGLYFITLPDSWAPLTAAGIIVLGMFIDGLDGLLARRWNAITDFGKVIDPLADKLCIAGAAVILIIYRDFPLWLTVVILGRDLLILVGGLYLRSKRDVTPMSNYIGKVTAFVIGATLIVYTLRTGLGWLEHGLVWLSAGLVFVSFIFYIRCFFKLLRENPDGEENS